MQTSSQNLRPPALLPLSQRRSRDIVVTIQVFQRQGYRAGQRVDKTITNNAILQRMTFSDLACIAMTVITVHLAELGLHLRRTSQDVVDQALDLRLDFVRLAEVTPTESTAALNHLLKPCLPNSLVVLGNAHCEHVSRGFGTHCSFAQPHSFREDRYQIQRRCVLLFGCSLTQGKGFIEITIRTPMVFVIGFEVLEAGKTGAQVFVLCNGVWVDSLRHQTTG